ncbi:MAG TPA: hypothetical protein VKE22_25725 [Haliangiales bacterium]|nr:hypothetical protein [Haliangiales bacterium]
MIPHPRGWTVTFVEDAEILIPPEGLEAGAIRYLEGLAPVRSVAELVDAQLAEDGLDVEHVGPTRELVTGEGEYAALVTVTGTADGRPVRRDLGYVLCDDHYARVGAVARRPELFARFGDTVEHLVRHCTQMLGVRRRRFRYDAPPGWVEARVGLRSEWLAPGFPEVPGAITVWPALPLSLGGAAFAQGLGRGARGPFPARTRHGLSGDRFERTIALDGGGHVQRDLMVLKDDTYVYTMRAEHADPVHKQVFDELVDSAQPIPRAARAVAVASRAELFSYWN